MKHELKVNTATVATDVHISKLFKAAKQCPPVTFSM